VVAAATSLQAGRSLGAVAQQIKATQAARVAEQAQRTVAVVVAAQAVLGALV
jgi:hypothetical protein